MEIAWFGSYCFRIRNRNSIALVDPYLPDPKYQNLQIKADVISISQIGRKIRKVVPNQREAVYRVERPGEYEIGGIFIDAIPVTITSEEQGSENLHPIAVTLTLDDLTVCHLGQLDNVPSSSIIEQLGSPDILILPAGGTENLTCEQSVKLVKSLSPAYVIPISHPDPDSLATSSIDKFIKELGVEKPEIANNLNISRGGITHDVTSVVLLQSRTREKRPPGENA
tara:strand:- start:545 stop:1219 length:675 start_codon:yes stop_codon:yes gene_type:complete